MMGMQQSEPVKSATSSIYKQLRFYYYLKIIIIVIFFDYYQICSPSKNVQITLLLLVMLVFLTKVLAISLKVSRFSSGEKTRVM